MSNKYQELIDLIRLLEKAVDDHPRLYRWRNSRAELAIDDDSEDCWTVRITVKVKGSNRRAHEIWNVGNTPEEAVARLIGQLDIWATSL
jgi:hypothetical protein